MEAIEIEQSVLTAATALGLEFGPIVMVCETIFIPEN
jgi:hypothetical protein